MNSGNRKPDIENNSNNFLIKKLRSRARYMIFIGAFVASILSYCMLRNGILAFPDDSWAYWEGSVSMLEGNNYTYFGGEPIKAWPPLFSTYLAIFQYILGKTGFALIVAMSCLAFLNTSAWLAFVSSYFKACLIQKNTPCFLLCVTFVVLFIPSCSIWLMAHFLLLGFIGLMLFILVRMHGASTRSFALLVVTMTVTQACSLLTHNSAITLIPAICLVFVTDSQRKISHRFIACSFYAFFGIASSLAVLIMLQQTHEHPLGEPRYGLLTYLHQTLGGLGQFFSTTSLYIIFYPTYSWLSTALGFILILFVAWGFLSVNRSYRNVWRIPVVVAGVSYVFLLLIVNLTWIAAPLSDRFIYYIALCLISATCIQFSQKPFWIILCFFPILLGAQSLRALKGGIRGIVSPIHSQAPSDPWIRENYFITGDNTEYLIPAGYIKVLPPTFSYMERWKTTANHSSEGKVTLEFNP